MNIEIELKPSKAEPVSIRRDMSVGEGFETIVSACLRHFQLNEPSAIETRNAEALHQARVAMRRLRSALSLFRRPVHDCEFERIDDELHWFTAELGDARNLDVYLADPNLSRDQRLFVEERRNKAYDLVIAAMNSDRCRQLVLKTLAWAATGRWHDGPLAAQPLEPFVNKRIDRLWRKISKSKHIEAMDDRQQHRLRIKMKKLRYALEFAAVLHSRKPNRRKRFAKTTKQLQKTLGELHDIVTARSLAALNSWLMVPDSSKRVRKRLARKADRSLKHLRRIGPYWRASPVAPPLAAIAAGERR